MQICQIGGLLSLCAVIGLGGCGGGGGGGGGGSSGDPKVPSAAIVLTNANGQQVSSETVGGLAGPTVAVSVVPTGSSTSASTNVGIRHHIHAIASIGKILGSLQQPSSPLAAHATTTSPCLSGGTSTVSPADSGTAVTVTFSNCNESGTVTNGNVALTNLSRAGPNRVVGNAVTDVSVSGPGPTERLRSTFSLDLTLSSISNFTITLSGNRMFLEKPGKTESLTNYSLTIGVANFLPASLDGGFTYASTVINGSIRANIVQTIRSDGSSDTPDSGVIDVVDAAGSKVQVTILGDQNIVGDQLRFDIDADGAPGFETTRFAQWSSIP